MADVETADVQGLDLRSRLSRDFSLRIWGQRQAQSFFFALGHLSRTWGSTLLTTLVIAVALAFPGGLFVLLQNASNLADGWDSRAELSVFLRPEVSVAQAQDWQGELQVWPELVSVSLISPADALAEFERSSGMSGVSVLLDGKNPLPVILSVRLEAAVGPAEIPVILERLRANNLVESVDLDLAWLKRLRAIIRLFERGVGVLAAFLAIGVLLIVGNSIRADIDSQRDAIEISLLFGATHAFIRRPFLYGGMLIGVVGAGLAWAIVAVALALISTPFAELAALYTSPHQLRALGFLEGLALLAGGLFLGAVGASLAVGRHLRAISPG